LQIRAAGGVAAVGSGGGATAKAVAKKPLSVKRKPVTKKKIATMVATTRKRRAPLKSMVFDHILKKIK
jgi:hypothetical protein